MYGKRVVDWNTQQIILPCINRSRDAWKIETGVCIK